MIAAATDFAGLVRRLLECEVEFIIVGGLASNVHGAGRATYAVDVVLPPTRRR
jgi:hypothetical protein